MRTRVYPPDDISIAKAARLLRDGKLVAFPTETVYGLGASALDARAVGSIFDAKGRPGDNPLIVHIHEIAQLEGIVDWGAGEGWQEAAQALMTAFWPGALTLIMPKAQAVPPEVTAGLNTVAVRMPSHPVALRLLKEAGIPVAAPSANRSGRPSPTCAAHVLGDMDGRIAAVIDGGASDQGVESTVLDLACGAPRILRPGFVTLEMISGVAPDAAMDDGAMRDAAPGETPRSPGMKHRHYAPKGRMTVFVGAPEAVERRMAEVYDEQVARGARAVLLMLPGSVAAMGARNVRVLGASAVSSAAARSVGAGTSGEDLREDTVNAGSHSCDFDQVFPGASSSVGVGADSAEVPASALAGSGAEAPVSALTGPGGAEVPASSLVGSDSGEAPSSAITGPTSADDPAAVAASLYTLLRDADDEGAEIILAQGVPQQGVGMAVMNRMARAAGFQVENVGDGAGQGTSLETEKQNRPRHIIFVCSGNTCRSPMAEALLKAELKKLGVVGMKVSSAGVAAYPGDPASMGCARAMERRGLDVGAHRSRKLREAYRPGALLLCMAPGHVEAAQDDLPGCDARLMMEYAGLGRVAVADPFGGGDREYERAAAQIMRAVIAIAARLADME